MTEPSFRPACVDDFSGEDCMGCIETNGHLCGVEKDIMLYWAHLFVGLTTFFHALHTLPMWGSVCKRASYDCNQFISLLLGNLVAFGIQSILWPFTYLKDSKYDKIRRLYTHIQVWWGGIVGWFFTLFNLIWLIYNHVTYENDDYLRIILPYVAIEMIFWITYYAYAFNSFRFISTANLMPIAGKKVREAEENGETWEQVSGELERTGEWTIFNGGF